MKKVDLKSRALAEKEGESVFGLQDTGSHACYMIYGYLKPGEKQRLVKPGKGHEEMVMAAKGILHLTGEFTGTLHEGEVFHIVGEQSVFVENPSSHEAVYIIAGGHSEGVHHH